MIRRGLLVWIALSLVFGVVWVHQEGWVMRPAPMHWWWWALSGWMSGFGARPILDGWLARRRMSRLQREILSWHDRLPVTATPMRADGQRIVVDEPHRQPPGKPS